MIRDEYLTGALGYVRPMRDILELDDILAKDWRRGVSAVCLRARRIAGGLIQDV
jgi:hypothetical protein